MSFLQRFFDPPVELSGLYGIEHRSGDDVTVDETAVKWMPVISSVAADATKRFGEGVLEDKTYSLTVHYRRETPAVAAAIEAWSEMVATEHGLSARSAKMSIELHPPISRNKGDAVEDMLNGLTAAVYFGDDIGDCSAFERLLSAKSNGSIQAAAAVLVKGPETPDELTGVVTDVVSQPTDVVAMLDRLVDAASSAGE